MNIMVNPDTEAKKAHMQSLLLRQKAAQANASPPSAALRIDRINRCIDLLVERKNDIVEALSADFGRRSKDASLLTDVVGSIGPLKHARSHLKTWMKPERRAPESPFGLLGARAEVRYQPKGVVGVISPWNFPINLTFAPLAGILAAGNSAMIKPSEFTPATSALLEEMIRARFDETELTVTIGGADVGAAFAGLPFDHLIFTGGTAVGHHVMRAAADNLTPVTLELGGKSPVIIGRSADLGRAAMRIMAGKTLNAGQICLAPDYVLAPESQTNAFVSAATAAVAQMFPTIKDNPDYTAIISQRHFDRLKAMIEDASEKGAQIVEINPAREDFSQQEHRIIPPTLVLGATSDMRVMQEEIFGPILPILGYGAINDAIKTVNDAPRPLGLYYFGSDAAEKDAVVDKTISGGVTINDVITHVAQENLPFGGIGPSGMGAYHGREGFLEFSHRRSIYTQSGVEAVVALIRPPYTDNFRKLIAGRAKA